MIVSPIFNNLSKVNFISMDKLIILTFIILIGIIVIQTIVIFDGYKKRNEDFSILDRMRFFWPHIVFYVFATSIISIFIMSIIFEKSVTLSNLNNWVGIILGFSSWIISIISLFLSFDTIDRNLKRMDTISDSVKETVRSLKGNGWSQDNIGWFYLINGDRVKNQFKRSGNGVFYLGEYGYIVKNIMMIIDGKRYCFDDNGTMIVNNVYRLSDGHKVFCGDDGQVIENGEVVLNNIKYTIKDFYIFSEDPIR